jgi:hypothetical protein
VAKASAFSAGFDEATFRSAIAETMVMGLPEDPAQRLTWWWRRDETFSPDDPGGHPYDWSQPPVLDAPGNPAVTDPGTPGEQSLVVNYALEYAARPAGSSNTAFGGIDTSRAVVSLADSDWEKIRTADYATVGNTRYLIQFQGPPVGLFGFTLYQIYLQTEDAAS